MTGCRPYPIVVEWTEDVCMFYTALNSSSGLNVSAYINVPDDSSYRFRGTEYDCTVWSGVTSPSVDESEMMSRGCLDVISAN